MWKRTVRVLVADDRRRDETDGVLPGRQLLPARAAAREPERVAAGQHVAEAYDRPEQPVGVEEVDPELLERQQLRERRRAVDAARDHRENGGVGVGRNEGRLRQSRAGSTAACPGQVSAIAQRTRNGAANCGTIRSTPDRPPGADGSVGTRPNTPTDADCPDLQGQPARRHLETRARARAGRVDRDLRAGAARRCAR